MHHPRPPWRPRNVGKLAALALSAPPPPRARCCASGRRRPVDAPLRMAVVGSGPAGFYTASRVMARLPNARIDMYEALPVPFGLVRYGVAPDHPEVKNCQVRFDEIASSPYFRFIGNVSVGRPGPSAQHCTVELPSLMRHYDSVLLAYGASEDKKLGIPGESTLSGIYSARHFVGWYSGLPDCAGLEPDLARGNGEAVIIGQGNVALDVARMLLQDIDVLRKTDIAEHALARLATSRVRRVRIIGRRGPMQAAFTIKEVRELMKLPGVAFDPVDRSLIPEDLASLPRASKRLMEVLLRGSRTAAAEASKTWSLDSCLLPRHFLGHRDRPTAVASTELDVTRLAAPFDPQSRAMTAGETVVVPSDLVFRSVGFRSMALPGFAEAGIPFDERRGVVSNDGLGRVTRRVSPDKDGGAAAEQAAAGMYCAGWVKGGPTGVIASTMQDAFATGDAIVQDWLSGARFLRRDPGHVAGGWEAVRQEAGPRAAASVSWDQWRSIDMAERSRGAKAGKEREKFTSTADMLAAVEGSSSAAGSAQS